MDLAPISTALFFKPTMAVSFRSKLKLRKLLKGYTPTEGFSLVNITTTVFIKGISALGSVGT